MFGASYTYANATDNVVSIGGLPSDSFVGAVPEVTDPGNPLTNCPSRNNRNGSFIACNGNSIAQAGTFSNGPDLDKGLSNLALDHIFQINGLISLSWQIQLSGIFRIQSGFRYSKSPINLADPDGDSFFVNRDIIAGRNAFKAPPYTNLDMRAAKTFKISERVKVQLLVEFFNVLNRQNPHSQTARNERHSRNFYAIDESAFGDWTQCRSPKNQTNV